MLEPADKIRADWIERNTDFVKRRDYVGGVE
jgi:hypothetical protein